MIPSLPSSSIGIYLLLNIILLIIFSGLQQYEQVLKASFFFYFPILHFTRLLDLGFRSWSLDGTNEFSVAHSCHLLVWGFAARREVLIFLYFQMILEESNNSYQLAIETFVRDMELCTLALYHNPGPFSG